MTMTSFLTSLPPSILKKKAKTPEQLALNLKSSLKFVSQLKKSCTNTMSVEISIDRNMDVCQNTVVQNLSDVTNETFYTELDGVNRCLQEIKNTLYGEASNSQQTDDGRRSDLRFQHEDEIILEISRFFQSSDLFVILIDNFSLLPFESRKNTALIFNCLMKKDTSLAEYLEQQEHRVVVDQLIAGYTDPDVALSCGSMIRECIKHDKLALYILNCDQFARFFDEFVSLPNFDVAADAFSTMKCLLTTPSNRRISSDFIDQHYEFVFTKYELLLLSENYVTKKRSISLLYELLLERSNYNIMIRYLSSKNNLKTIMNLLRHKSTSIQYETFQVFKLFVANPNKSQEVVSVFLANRAKLVAYLEGFHLDNTDPQFVDEKRLLIDTLSGLSDPER